MSTTHVRQDKVSVGVEDNGEKCEDNLQEGKLEGAKFEEEESPSGSGPEKTIHLHF